jgi:hypothetical protein
MRRLPGHDRGDEKINRTFVEGLDAALVVERHGVGQRCGERKAEIKVV